MIKNYYNCVERIKSVNWRKIFFITISIVILLSLMTGSFFIGRLTLHKENKRLENEKIALDAEIYQLATIPVTFDYTIATKSIVEERIRLLSKTLENFEELNIDNNLFYETLVYEKFRAEEHLMLNSYFSPYTQEDLDLMTAIIYIEAGSNSMLDEEQKSVGAVVYNRMLRGGVNGNKPGITIKEVINETGQYAICQYNKKTGVTKYKIDYIDDEVVKVDLSNGKIVYTYKMDEIPDRCRLNAIEVLEQRFTLPIEVIFQAQFKQGSGVYSQFKHSDGTTTYFCYSRY